MPTLPLSQYRVHNNAIDQKLQRTLMAGEERVPSVLDRLFRQTDRREQVLDLL